jgi:transketolase
MTELIASKCADNIRILAAAMVEKAKSGHPGGAMGGADFIHVLFSDFLVYDPDDMAWPNRDRFFLDPGHMSPLLYSVLHLAGQTIGRINGVSAAAVNATPAIRHRGRRSEEPPRPGTAQAQRPR